MSQDSEEEAPPEEAPTEAEENEGTNGTIHIESDTPPTQSPTHTPTPTPISTPPRSPLASQSSQATQATQTTPTTPQTKEPPPIKRSEQTVIMVEEPGTIIELVDLYVPPPPPIILPPSQLFFMRQPPPPVRMLPVRHHPASGVHMHHQTNGQYWCQVGSSCPMVYTDAVGAKAPEPPRTAQSTRGRKRGRKPGPSRGGRGRGAGAGRAPSRGRGGKRPRRPPSPPSPPLPPPPNFLENFINPLENDIYPKVIVQPAHQPWVIPQNLDEDHPQTPPRASYRCTRPHPMSPCKHEHHFPRLSAFNLLPPRPKTPPKPPPQPPPLPSPSPSIAQLCQNLKLFGPDVTITKLASPGSGRFLAVRQQANGQQRQMIFTADQLQSFRNTVRLRQAQAQTQPRPAQPRRNPPQPRPAPAPAPAPTPAPPQIEYLTVQRAPVFRMPPPRVPLPKPPPNAYKYFDPPRLEPSPVLASRFPILRPFVLKRQEKPAATVPQKPIPFFKASTSRVVQVPAPVPVPDSGPGSSQAPGPAQDQDQVPAPAQDQTQASDPVASPAQSPVPFTQSSSPCSPYRLPPALPTILNHKSQMKLLSTLKIQRAKAKARAEKAAQEAREAAKAAAKAAAEAAAKEEERKRERKKAVREALEAQAAQDPQTSAQAYRNVLLDPLYNDDSD